MTSALKVVTEQSSPPVQIFRDHWNKLYTINVYNTDDALTQGAWSKFQQDIKHIVCSDDTTVIHGVWYTPGHIDYRSMSISFNLSGEFPEMVIREFKGFLKGLSEEYPGCTVQWLESEVQYL